MPFDEEYFESEEFQELLSSYEEAVESGQPPMLDADDFIDLADYYNYQGDLEAAEEVVDHALTFYPGDALLNVFKARTCLQDDDYDGANEFAGKIIDQDSPDFHYLSAELMIAQGRIDEADQYLRDYGLTVPADEYEDFVKDVINLYVDYEVSDKAYEWLLRSKGDDSDDFKELMGRTLFGLGKYQDSQRIFNELIDRNPFSKYYWNALAEAQFMDEDYPNAISSSEYAIAIDPSDPEGLLTKASSLFRMGSYEQAVDYFERYAKAVPEDEENIYALLHQGVCLINLCRYDEALPRLEHAVSLAHEDDELLPQIYEELAFAYSALKQPDLAIQMLDRTDALDCDHVNMHVIRGHILLENGRFQQAERSFKTAMRLSDGDPAIILRVIVSLYDNRYVSAAYEMFQKFYELVVDQDFNDGYAYMALCCYDLGYTEEFLHYIRLAAERNPHEARLVLNPLFPEGMDVKDYYSYMCKKLRD